MKACSKCGELKEANLENFYKNKESKDGLHGTCKRCYSVYKSAYKKKQTRIAKKLRENASSVVVEVKTPKSITVTVKDGAGRTTTHEVSFDNVKGDSDSVHLYSGDNLVFSFKPALLVDLVQHNKSHPTPEI